jgi:hypothetical protein
MSIVLFAMIGAAIHAGTAYWICFGVYCALHLGKALYEASKESKE